MEELRRLRIAIVGTGVSGLTAAWLLHPRHDIVVYEKANRVGGHSNTVTVRAADGDVSVDTGFIVFNPLTYPNFIALLESLCVAWDPSDMSFSASLDKGAHEYGGGSLRALLGQAGNVLRPRYWAMLKDLVRFYRTAPSALATPAARALTLGQFLKHGRYGAAFIEDHIAPMAAAIWSAPAAAILDYPALAFIRFYENHGLFRFVGRPVWRSVHGGSRAYVSVLTQGFADRIRVNAGVARIERSPAGVRVFAADGSAELFDDVVLATHADQALAALAEPSEEERRLLGAFRYSRNVAVLHRDESFMPRRRVNWSSWNVFDEGDARAPVAVTYWMNALQKLPTRENLFVTLNPGRPLAPDAEFFRETYEHPIFDFPALAAQEGLWELQGRNRTWFCGAHFGSGFHEDGVQSGLAVAEALGGVRRPWRVAGESSRIPSWRPAPAGAPRPAFA